MALHPLFTLNTPEIKLIDPIKLEELDAIVESPPTDNKIVV